MHQSYHLAVKILSTLRNGVSSSLSLNWLRGGPSERSVGTTDTDAAGGEVDSSPSSSFESTPPYNLRQRKPGINRYTFFTRAPSEEKGNKFHLDVPFILIVFCLLVIKVSL